MVRWFFLLGSAVRGRSFLRGGAVEGRSFLLGLMVCSSIAGRWCERTEVGGVRSIPPLPPIVTGTLFVDRVTRNVRRLYL